MNYLLFAAAMVAFFIYRISFLKLDKKRTNNRILEALFIKRVDLLEKLAKQCITIEQINSLNKYFTKHLLEPYQNSPEHLEYLKPLQSLINSKINSLCPINTF